VNLASPYIYEEQAIKYIDYDLDYKLLPDGKWELLDQKEYDENSKSYGYSPEIQAIIAETQKELEDFIKRNHLNIQPEKIIEIFDKYDDYIKKYKTLFLFEINF
jgi:protein associated with RNAse G/E